MKKLPLPLVSRFIKIRKQIMNTQALLYHLNLDEFTHLIIIQNFNVIDYTIIKIVTYKINLV